MRVERERIVELKAQVYSLRQIAANLGVGSGRFAKDPRETERKNPTETHHGRPPFNGT